MKAIFTLVRSRQLLKPVLLTIFGVILLTISSKISIPFVPVPFTLQNMAVAMIGLAFGSMVGVASILTFLFLGFTSLPLFTFGGGVAYMFSPTVGYLYGMIFAAFLAGRVNDLKLPFFKASVLLAASFVIILLCGVCVLSYFVGWPKALEAGLYPFIWGCLLKYLIALLFYVGMSKTKIWH